MATRSSTIAATGVFLTVVALLFLWASVLIPILEILARRIGVSGPNPEWATFLNAINPYHAYQALAATQFIDVGGMGEALISGETFYETPPFAALVMVFWSVVVPALGFQSFNNSDL